MLNDSNPKKTSDMSRTELIYELSRHMKPYHFKRISAWSTKAIGNLLADYRGDNKPVVSKKIKRPMKGVNPDRIS